MSPVKKLPIPYFSVPLIVVNKEESRRSKKLWKVRRIYNKHLFCGATTKTCAVVYSNC